MSECRVKRRWTVFLMIAVVTFVAAGCGAPDAQFRLNSVYLKGQEKQSGAILPDQQKKDVKDILVALFGTPDNPHVPALTDVDATELFQSSKLQMAAGRVWSAEDGQPHGLYREHCAHCHGITGDGAGPTAEFLNPYPRDYRLGVFKFKSTPIGQRPTHEDLQAILINGIPGTAMPSFKLLPDDELEALLQYVKYLAVRGEVERALIYECANELNAEDRLLDITSEKAQSDGKYIASLASDAIDKWLTASTKSIMIPARPENMDMAESIKIGRELFFGPVANCVKCHGSTAIGDGQKTDYDDWTKDWTTKVGVDPKDPEAIAPFLAVGAFPPRNIHPRNLRLGVYRGGRRPIDLYRRLRNGIEGTPMPAVPQTLQSDDVWHLIDYVRSLPYDNFSQSGSHKPGYHRERL